MDIEAVSSALHQANSIWIIGHKNGDADCYGSAFALSIALRKLGKRAVVISPEKYPENLDFLLYYYDGKIVSEADFSPEVLVVVDTSDINRAVAPNVINEQLNSAAKLLYIDHHTKGDIEDLFNVGIRDEKASSTSELIYKIVTNLGVIIDKNIASLLLAGILADTSSFQNQNTTHDSLEISADLLKKGARKKAIVSQLFGGSEADALKLWGLAMSRLNFNRRYKVASTFLTYDDIVSCGISGEAISGIVNYLNQIKDAKIVLLATEEERGVIKVSLRTRDDSVDVAALARQIGGGGHIKASGVSFPGILSADGCIQ